MAEFDIRVTVVRRADRRFLTMRYEDPVTGQLVTRSAKTTKRREAEREAAKWEKELREGKYHKPSNITWEEFRERYETEKLSSLSVNTLEATTTAFNHLERIIAPKRLAALTSVPLSKFQSELRKSGIEETSIATHLRHLRAPLNWAVSMGMLPKAPLFSMPKRASGRKLMRGRPLTADEFDRMSASAPQLRPDDTAVWLHYLQGLWLSGLRMEESTVVSWDDDAPISIDMTGKWPRLRIYAEAEKGQEDRLLPVTPDFSEFLSATPGEQRVGRVFPIRSLTTGQMMTPQRVSRVVSACGKEAGILVNKAKEKYASAHDLRRSFGTRWASRVMPATLQLLMRHKSVGTTMKYYVEQNADEVAEQLWRGFDPSAQA